MSTSCDEEKLLIKHATIVQNQLLPPNMRSRQKTTEDEQEYMMVMRYMHYSLKKVAKSKFYGNLVDQLKNNDDLKSKFSKALGSHTHMPLVIYELGSIQFSFTHRLRFALALLLKHDFSYMIDSVQVHISSLNMNDIEVRVMNDMGCNIIIDDENCVNYLIDKPTLLYLPYPNSETLANLIEENWCPATRLNQMVILSNSMKDIVKGFECVITEIDKRSEIASDRLTQKYERLRYVWVVQKLCEEVGIDGEMWNLYRQKYWEHEHYVQFEEREREQMIYNLHYKAIFPFSTLGLHFFHLDFSTDLKTLLPSFLSSIKLPPQCNFKAWNKAGYLIDEESMVESSRVIKDIEDIMKDMEESDFYMYMRNELRKPEVKLLISHMLVYEKKAPMVLYGVGSIEQAYESQIQFALALLLKKHSDIPIGDIEIIDETLTIADKKAMSDMGCKVLDLDLKNSHRRVQKPTFFFIDTEDCDELTAILEENFCPSRLNKICVLSRHFNHSYYHQYCRGLSRHNRHLVFNHRRINISYYGYDRALIKHTICFQISKQVDAGIFLGKMLMMKFYVVDNYTDLYTYLPRATIKGIVRCHNIRDYTRRDIYHDPVASLHNYIKDLIHSRFDDGGENNTNNVNNANDEDNANEFYENPDYLVCRWPVRLRSSWSRPQSGWLKLNFNGNQHSKGFGGVIHDEDGKLLVSYAGSILNPEENANIEALRHGSRCILAYFESKKLIIEGDSLPLVLWSNGLFPGDRKHEKALNEIKKSRRGRNWAFVHVYPEANKKAEEMTVRGAQLRQTCRIWDHRGTNVDHKRGICLGTEDGNDIRFFWFFLLASSLFYYL